jgi:hypothetical protein
LKRIGIECEVGLIEYGDIILRDIVLIGLINEDRLGNIDVLPFALVILQKFIEDDLNFRNKLFIKLLFNGITIFFYVI